MDALPKKRQPDDIYKPVKKVKLEITQVHSILRPPQLILKYPKTNK